MFNSSFWHKRNFFFYEPSQDLELAKWSINPLISFEVAAVECERSLLHLLDILGPEILLTFGALSVKLHFGHMC
jgi:hypothetical protein